MAQQTTGDFNIVAASTTGIQLADILNRMNAALNSAHSGATAPTYLLNGMMWLDTAIAATHILKEYNVATTAWVELVRIDTATGDTLFSGSSVPTSGDHLPNKTYTDAGDAAEHAYTDTKVTWISTSIAISTDATALHSDDATTNYNIGIGPSAGYDITSGTYNCTIGAFAGLGIISGGYNIAIGNEAMKSPVSGVTGSANIAIGSEAGLYMEDGDTNIHIGSKAGAFQDGPQTVELEDLNDTICIGRNSYATATGEMSFGNSDLISAAYTAAAFSQRSDERYKDFQAMDLGLDFINSIEPKKFTWNTGADQTSINYGFSAQQVKKTLDDSVGKSVRSMHKMRGDEQNLTYTEFVAPLVKAVQELSDINKDLLSRIEALEAD